MLIENQLIVSHQEEPKIALLEPCNQEKKDHSTLPSYLARGGCWAGLGFRRGRGRPAAGSMSRESARKSSCTVDV